MLIPWQHTRPPRRWQAEALDTLAAYFARGGSAGLISAIMGAGKTALTAEICRMYWRRGATLVVTVPSQALVVQTVAALQERLGASLVGAYWERARDLRPVIVCCTASLAALAEEPINVHLWLADEAHGTEAAGALAFECTCRLDDMTPGHRASKWLIPVIAPVELVLLLLLLLLLLARGGVRQKRGREK
jgi:hypothetical protein